MGERLRLPAKGVLLALLLVPRPVAAQQPERLPPDAPGDEAPGPRPGAGGRHGRPESGLLSAAEEAPSEIRIKAETAGGVPGHFWYRGVVDLTAGETRIQCDQ